MRIAMLVSIGMLALLAAPSAGRGGPDARHPVTVGTLRIEAGPLPSVDRRIEAAWLRDEARALGIAPGPGLKARVADRLAGPRGTGIPGAFVRFHARRRATTRCLPSVHDAYADRCVDRAPAATGACRWMGSATICRLARGWLVVQRGTRRFRRRAGAVAAARGAYRRARARRVRQARAVRARRAQRSRDAIRRRVDAVERVRAAALAARRAALRADPRLSPSARRTAGRACRRHARAAELYLFGLGLQDPRGQAAGLLAARRTLSARIRRAAPSGLDRRRVRALLVALAAGDEHLRRMRFDAFEGGLRREARLARRAGLRDCSSR